MTGFYTVFTVKLNCRISQSSHYCLKFNVTVSLKFVFFLLWKSSNICEHIEDSMVNPYILSFSFNNYQHLANLVSLIPWIILKWNQDIIILLRVYLFLDVRYYIYFKSYVFTWYVAATLLWSDLLNLLWSDLFSAFCN